MKQNVCVYHKRQTSIAVCLARKRKTFNHNFPIIRLYPIERNLSFPLKVEIGPVVRKKEYKVLKNFKVTNRRYTTGNQ